MMNLYIVLSLLVEGQTTFRIITLDQAPLKQIISDPGGTGSGSITLPRGLTVIKYFATKES